MFVLDDKGAKRDAYRAQVPDVDDRLIFVDVPPSDPDAAVTVVNDPISDAARIRDLVTQGFIVRTRADADTVEARSGDTTRRDAAFASGAQYVSTDYVFPDDFGTGYVVDLPGTDAARCNPVARPSGASRPTSAADGRASGTFPMGMCPPARPSPATPDGVGLRPTLSHLMRTVRQNQDRGIGSAGHLPRSVLRAQTRRRSVAQRVSSWRLDSWSLRSTDDTCVSIVLIDTWSRRAISLYV